jgi:hypothetical protein
VVTDIVFFHTNRRKPHGPAFVNRPPRLETIEFRPVRNNAGVFLIRLQDLCSAQNTVARLFAGLVDARFFGEAADFFIQISCAESMGRPKV